MAPSTVNPQHSYQPTDFSFPNMPDMNAYYQNMIMSTPMRNGSTDGSLMTTPSTDESGLFEGSPFGFSNMTVQTSSASYSYQPPQGQVTQSQQETSPAQLVPQGCLTPETTEQPEHQPKVQDQRQAGGGVVRVSRNVETVQGRLNIVNNQRTYNVSRDEILRRLTGVEKMNASTLAAMLRKSKVKNGGSDLRSQLSKWDINVEVNKRSASKSSTFTCLVEEEASQLSQDLDILVNKHFPFNALSAKMVAKTNPEELYNLRDQFTIAQEAMRKIGEILESTTVPLGCVTSDGIQDSGPFQEGMEKVSQLTHGFAVQNSRTWSREFYGLFKKTADMADSQIKKFEHQLTMQGGPWAPINFQGMPPQAPQPNTDPMNQMWNANQYQPQHTQNPNQQA